MTSPKEYINKGVQTDPPYLCEHKSVQAGTGSAHGSYNDDLSLPLPNTSSPYSYERSKKFQGAYIHPNGLLVAHEAPAERHYKSPQIPYNRPSDAVSRERRIISLPETVPSCLVRTSSEAQSRRVVSLSSLQSIPSEGLDRSGEYSQLSASTIDGLYVSSDDFHGSSQLQNDTDLPQTPSPPSSPESVTIISNPDLQVPTAFLHASKQQESSPRIQVTEDEDGWVSWTNSPPRPIPALHGPLSLPYARCPSGEADETQVRAQGNGQYPNTLADNDNPLRNRFNSIDVPAINFRQAPRHSQVIGASAPPRINPEDVYPRLQCELAPHRAQSRPLNLVTRDGLNDMKHWGTSSLAHLQNLKGVNSVPRQFGDSAFALDSLRLFIPARETSITNEDRRNGRFAHSYRDEILERQQTDYQREKIWSTGSALSPRSPASPHWTPLFSSYLDMFGSPDMATLDAAYGTRGMNTKTVSRIQRPKMPSPVVDDLSEELRRFVFESITNSANPRLRMETTPTLADIPRSKQSHGSPLLEMSQLATPCSPYERRSDHVTMSPLQPRPPPNSPMPPESSRYVQTNDLRATPASPTQIPLSPTLPGGSNPRQLRSIPFARLMQRRLSVVQEEDSQPINERPSSFLQSDEVRRLPEPSQPAHYSRNSRSPKLMTRFQKYGRDGFQSNSPWAPTPPEVIGVGSAATIVQPLSAKKHNATPSNDNAGHKTDGPNKRRFRTKKTKVTRD